MWICESTISIAFFPDLGFNRRTMIGFARRINHPGASKGWEYQG
jgi:hypothetical protein